MSVFLPMCGDDSHPKKVADSGSASDSGTPGTGRDAGLDGGHTGTGLDGGGGPGGDASRDGSKPGADDGAVADAGDGGTKPAAAWHLWVMENTTGHLYGYAPQQLTATNGDAPDIDITLSDKIASLHFDAQGNLWGTLGGTAVVQYAAKDLKQSGIATAAIKFTEAITAANEAVDFLAFDSSGNLWTSGHQGHGAWRYDASSLAALTPTSPAQTPAFKLTTSVPSEVAFDKIGNLYATVYPGGGAANAGRFAASQLVGTGASSDAPVDLLGTVQFFSSLFFSPSGQLVIASQEGNVYRLSGTQLAATGNANANTTPETTFTISGFNNPGWGTYDPTGVLWISGNSNHLVAISAADLAKTGAVTVTTPGVTLRAPTANSSANFGSIAIH